METFRVVVPPGVAPGASFKCLIRGQEHVVTCPTYARPGQEIMIQVQVHRSSPTGPMTNANYHFQPPPPPLAHQNYQPPMRQQQPQQSYNVQGLTPTASAPAGLETYSDSLHVSSGGGMRTSGYVSIQGINPESLFEMIEVNRQGKATARQILTALEYAGLRNFKLETCNIMVNMFDKDMTNVVTKNDFLTLFSYIISWQKLYEEYDLDRNGSISLNELKSAVQAFGYRFSDHFFRLLFAKYDKDKNGSISFEEFIQLFCELHILTEAFKQHDAERNGVARFQYEDFLKACFSIHT